MIITLHKNFEKQYKKLRSGAQRAFKERKNLFLEDQFHPLLNNHPLKGAYTRYRSFNVGGDLRVIFKQVTEHEVVFVAVGLHNKLYG